MARSSEVMSGGWKGRMVRRVGRTAKMIMKWAAFGPLGRRAERRRQRLHLVMRALAHGAVPVTELAARTQLGQTIYPLLAELKRDGFVDQGWTSAQDAPRLVYWLTPKGLEHMERQ